MAETVDPHKLYRQALDEHATIIGRVTISWNTAQSLVFTIFQVASGMSYPNALAVFFALKSDISQRDITIALLDSELTTGHPEIAKLRDRLKKPIHKLSSLSSERNAAIHTAWGSVLLDGVAKVVPSGMVKHNPSLDLEDAAGQFERLEAKLGSVIDALTKAMVALYEYRAWQNTPDPRTHQRRERR